MVLVIESHVGSNGITLLPHKRQQMWHICSFESSNDVKYYNDNGNIYLSWKPRFSTGENVEKKI